VHTNRRIHLSSPHMGDWEERFVAEAFATNWIAPLGPHVDAFEREFCEVVGSIGAADDAERTDREDPTAVRGHLDLADGPVRVGCEGRDQVAGGIQCDQASAGDAGDVGEGHGEYLAAAREAGGEDVGDACRQNARLTRARTGEDEQGAFGGLYRFALFLVETSEVGRRLL
jgi:hypothetical protein